MGFSMDSTAELNNTCNVLSSEHQSKGDGFLKGSYQFHAPAGRYYVSLYWNGKRNKIWHYNGEPIWHEKTANKLLNKIRSEIDDGVFLIQSYMPKSPLSIKSYSEQWLKTLSVTPTTIKFYQKALKHSIDYFGEDFDVRHFIPSKLDIFYKELPLTTKGKYHVLNTLKSMLKCAYKDEIIKKIPPFPKLKNGEQQEIKYLTYEQQQKVLSFLPVHDRGIFEFAMEYGLRIGEVCALQKDCITDNKITIKRAMSDGELRESTKTGIIRRYGITEHARSILENNPLCPSPFVFNRKNGTPYTWKSMTKKWKNACRKAEIDINLYNGIRHSLGCQLMDEGVEMEMVRDILGHTTSTMTRKYAQRSEIRITNVLEFRGKISGTLEEQKKEVNKR